METKEIVEESVEIDNSPVTSPETNEESSKSSEQVEEEESSPGKYSYLILTGIVINKNTRKKTIVNFSQNLC